MRLFIGFLFALAVALFAVQNSATVSIRVVAWMVETSLVLVIIGSAALGAVSAMLLGLPGTIRLRLKVREYEGKVKRLEAEVKELKNAPVAAPGPGPKAGQVDAKGVVHNDLVHEGSGSDPAGNT
ncbi:MAG: LapA family protein [Ignavibacteriales bacterium]